MIHFFSEIEVDVHNLQTQFSAAATSVLPNIRIEKACLPIKGDTLVFRELKGVIEESEVFSDALFNGFFIGVSSDSHIQCARADWNTNRDFI